MTPEERAEKERMERILQNRIQSQFGGTAGKVKYNQGLKGKHKMTRNTKAMPGWSDLDGRHKGALLGLGLGVTVGTLAMIGLRGATILREMGGELAAQFLPILIGLLLVFIMTAVGFVLGKVTE